MTSQLTKCFFSVLVLTLSLMCFALVANAQDPNPEQTARARREGPCRDPWVTIALNASKSGVTAIQGVGDVGECNTQLYGGGRWSSFGELYRYVEEARRNARQQNVAWVMSAAPNNNFNIDLKDTSTRETLWHIVAGGGGNVVSNDGAGLIGDGAGTYTLQAGAKRVIKLGKSVIIIKR